MKLQNLLIGIIFISTSLVLEQAYASGETICPSVSIIKCQIDGQWPTYISDSAPRSWGGTGNPGDSCQQLTFAQGAIIQPDIVACDYHYSGWASG